MRRHAIRLQALLERQEVLRGHGERVVRVFSVRRRRTTRLRPKADDKVSQADFHDRLFGNDVAAENVCIERSRLQHIASWDADLYQSDWRRDANARCLRCHVYDSSTRALN